MLNADDIFMVMNKVDDVILIRHQLDYNSVLKYTFEIKKSKQLAFLDCLVHRFENSLKTSV